MFNVLEDEDLRLKGLIYGRSKAGKTWVAATAPKPLFLLTEGDVAKVTLRQAQRELGLEKIPYIEIDTRDKFEEVINWINEQIIKGKFPFESVVLDSLTDLQQTVIKPAILAESPKYSPGREMRNLERMELGEYDWLVTATDKAVVALRDLPVHVFVTARVALVKSELWLAPDVQTSRYALSVAAHFNFVGYLEPVAVKNKMFRVLRVEPKDDIQIVANPSNALPPVIVNPNLTAIVEAVRNGTPLEQEIQPKNESEEEESA